MKTEREGRERQRIAVRPASSPSVIGVQVPVEGEKGPFERVPGRPFLGTVEDIPITGTGR